MQVGHPPAEPPPVLLVRVGLGPPVDLEVGRVVDRRLDPQDRPLLVVHLHAVGPHPVLEPHPLGPGGQVAARLPGEVPVGPAVGRHLAAQEPHHVAARQVQHAVPDEARVDGGQGRPVPEHDVRGPLRLLGRPVRVQRPALQHQARRQPRVGRGRHAGQPPRPVRPQLPVEQPLRLGRVRHGRQAVVPPHVPDAGGVQLPAQPLPAVQAHPQPERQPRLQADVHEPHARVDPVVVVVQALPPPGDQLRLPVRPVPVQVVRLARLDRLQQAHRPGRHPVPGRDPPGQVLLRHRRAGQVDHRPARVGHGPLAGRPDVGRQAVRPGPEVLEPHPPRPQAAHEPADVGQQPVGAPEQHPVEPAQAPGDTAGEPLYKLVHGVAPFGLEVKTISTSTLPGRATPFY